MLHRGLHSCRCSWGSGGAAAGITLCPCSSCAGRARRWCVLLHAHDSQVRRPGGEQLLRLCTLAELLGVVRLLETAPATHEPVVSATVSVAMTLLTHESRKCRLLLSTAVVQDAGCLS